MEQERKLVARIHRLEGQVRALERVLGSGDSQQIITQFEAVIAAAKAAFTEYSAITLADADISAETKLRLINRLIKNS